MILTDDFVFVHLPKTGGTFVSAVLKRLYGSGALDTDKHGTCNDIPASHRDRPIVSCVRNPFDRYVSQYQFGWWRRYPERYCGLAAMRGHLPHAPDISFSEFVELANQCFVGCYQSAPNGFANHHLTGIDRPGWHTEQFIRFFCHQPKTVFAGLDADALTTQRWRAALHDVTFLRVESLNQDLYQLLVEYGHEPGSIEFIRDADKIFPVEGGRANDDHWQSYYTPALTQRLLRQERLVFDMFPDYIAGAAQISPGTSAARTFPAHSSQPPAPAPQQAVGGKP